MAKAPGSNVSNGVRGTMNAPFSKAESSRMGTGGGEYGHNHAPFTKAQDTGKGGIPTKFFDGMSAKAATTQNAGMGGIAGINRTNPVGQRRFKQPK